MKIIIYNVSFLDYSLMHSCFIVVFVQLITNDAGTFKLKLLSYVTDIWNILDLITFVSYFVGLILRFIPVSICLECFYSARIILALNLMTFFFRVLHLFSVNPELGPKLVMIGRMVSLSTKLVSVFKEINRVALPEPSSLFFYFFLFYC